MIRSYEKKANLIIRYFYQITYLILLLDLVDNVPGTNTLRKIKYIYLIVVIVYILAIFRLKIKKNSIPVVLIFGLLLLHTILFGKFITNMEVKKQIDTHFKEMSILLCFIIGTLYVYGRNGQRAILLFAKETYRIFCVFLLWIGVTHSYNFTNPTKFIYTLQGDHSYRGSFGMNHANYLGSICCCALICSMYLIDNYRQRGSFKKSISDKRILRCVILDFYIGEILFSSSSRTAVLTTLVSIILYIGFNATELLGIYQNRQVIKACFYVVGMIIAFIFISSGGIDYLLQNSRRDNAWLVNYPIFANHYNKYTGMGYVNYYCFSYGTNFFRYNTWNVDNYYLYILFTTGYIGLLIIAISLAVAALFILRITICTENICGLCTIISLLMLGLAQTSILSYDHIVCIVYWVLIALVISNRFVSRDF